MIVELEGDALATYPDTTPPPGQRIDFSSPAVHWHRRELAALRSEFKRWLAANAPKAQIVAEYDIVLNGLALRLNGEAIETIRSSPKVRSAQYARAHRPTGA